MKGIIRVFAVVGICLGWGLSSEGAVIFEDNFDSQPEWSKTAVPGASNECDYLPCTGAPNNWTTWRAAPWEMPVRPPISITSSIAPDHTTGAGKAFFVQVQNINSDPNFASDAIIAKKFSQDYQELYIRFWLRTQTGWNWSPNINNAHKIIHLFHYDGVGNFFQNGTSGSESPLTFFDLATGHTYGTSMYYFTYRCSPVSSYYCTGGPDNDVLRPLNSGQSTAAGNWADGRWHRYDLHFKMNTSGLANGIAEFSYDGKLIVSRNTIQWILNGTPAGTGWNSLSVGGNSDTYWSGGSAEQWYAIDDLVVSTTPIGTVDPADNVLPSVSITAPINAASVSGVMTVAANASDNVGVSKVEFYLNGVLDKTLTVSPYSYTLDTRTKANGTYQLNARAYDATNNVGQSENISFVISNPSVQDTTAPVVNSFTMPTTASSLTVPVTAFSASDAVGVAGYKITESSTAPISSSTGWSATPPTSFTFSVSGVRTAHAWAKDAAGNVSASRSANVVITLPDTIAPSVSITAPSSGATVKGIVTISAAASDNIGVTKVEFYINNSLYRTIAVPPFSFTVDTSAEPNGNYTLTAKAYDAAGNVGESLNLSCSIDNSLQDTTAPVVNIFTMPATSSSLTVPVLAFSASDAIGVTGYLITESSTAPLPTDTRWSSVPPAHFTFSAPGVRTDYAWAKDAAGNVSSSRSASVAITLPDTIAPSVAITAPSSGATVRGWKTITALASDNVGVVKLEFYIDGALVFTDTDLPYTYSWNTKSYSRSSHLLTAKAYDAVGNSRVSATVTVRVK